MRCCDLGVKRHKWVNVLSNFTSPTCFPPSLRPSKSTVPPRFIPSPFVFIRVPSWLNNSHPTSRRQCVFIVKTLPFSPDLENFPRVFHSTSFSPNVYMGFLKSAFLISPNFQFSTLFFPNNHGPPTRVRCERVLFFPETCHTQPKNHERTATSSDRSTEHPLRESLPRSGGHPAGRRAGASSPAAFAPAFLSASLPSARLFPKPEICARLRFNQGKNPFNQA